jgi:hypothetical protein
MHFKGTPKLKSFGEINIKAFLMHNGPLKRDKSTAHNKRGRFNRFNIH